MWFLKIIIKIFLSRLNIPYSFWKKINIFKHGQMESFDYSRKIFEGHYKDMNQINVIDNPVIMEIGPGDSLFSMVYSRKYSNEKFYFLDVNDFATKNLSLYYGLHNSLIKEDYLTKKLEAPFATFEDVLNFYNASYLTSSLDSLRTLDDNSIDYIFSHSVLEHVRKYELNSIVREIYRILKPNGVISHNINYKDHLDESLNNLRFSEKIWESNIFAESGFYTNRIPAIEMHKMFKENRFKLVKEYFGKWDKLPLQRRCINNIFDCYTDEELSIPTSSFLGIKEN
tara:strand:+ start:191 stop:1042 length:852 start_codon:yes stop_codon:yes gene_type:complete